MYVYNLHMYIPKFLTNLLVMVSGQRFMFVFIRTVIIDNFCFLLFFRGDLSVLDGLYQCYSSSDRDVSDVL